MSAGPIESLTNVSAAGAGTVLDCIQPQLQQVMVVVSGNGVSAGAVQLQGSLDGSNWFNIGSAVTTSAADTISTPVTGTIPCRYLRASITTAITGGTVSAWVAAAGQ